MPRAKRQLTFATDSVKKAKMAMTPAALVQTVGLQALGSVMNTVTNKTFGSEGAIPVSMTGGQIVKLPPVKYRKKKVSTAARVNKNSNVVTYRYQMESPWHATYCANMLLNGYGGTKAGVTDSLQRWYPVTLYDLTSAPNYVDKTYLDVSGLETYEVDPLNRIRTGNVPVAYRVHGLANYNNVAENASIHRFMHTITFDTRKDQSVAATGVPVGNAWQLEYQKKPSNFLGNQLVTGAAASSNYATFAWSHGGTANYGANEENVARCLLPPVGKKPVHRSSKISLALQGANNVPIEYTIMVCSFDEEIAPGNGAWMVPSKLTDPANVGTAMNGTGVKSTTTVGATTDPDSLAAFRTDNNYVKFWTSFCGQWGDAPGTVDYKHIQKYVRVIKSKKVVIEPKTSIENDSIGHLRTVSMHLNWNKIRKYSWMSPDARGMHPTTETTSGGPGFSTRIDDCNACDTNVHPNSRIFLVVAARLPQVYSQIVGSTAKMVDVTGAGSFNGGALQATAGATYDITIRNTFELDE